MAKPTTTPLPDTAYWHHYQGRFSSLLNWQDVDAFWGKIAAMDAEWYVFENGQRVPTKPLGEDALSQVLADAKSLINSRRDMAYSGAIYVDDLEFPRMIKIFDPSNMGSVCSCSPERIMPRYTLSKMPPDALPEPVEPAPKGMLARMFRRANS
ncbi:MAG: hypothetical protein Q9M48_12190 [Rhodobacterales bacterium]|nr:hypothetical protein [Rhodobacterales bacterium]